jgi:uncharacterized coiled-coil protein SlyX
VVTSNADYSFDMAKVKNLKKRIRRLEARLQKGAKKLAKLKRKLGEAAATAAKTEAKPRIVVKKADNTSNVPVPIQKREQPLAPKVDTKPEAGMKERRVAKKKTRKLNLTPERRAQLAEAMRARWAAKRAAAAASI